ncbi:MULTISPECIES: superoxide dismutase family protein [Pseudomonas]|uniref:Superoxide dismutase [Cu-Zn] n=1 Tax=Pseudomonas fluorescens TaxID=294 RepID=A0A5E6RXS5_PSEFL|nr:MULTISPECIES: superoxide dismutase family protein [Pseudomonas]VVM69745.1 Superoxide dismutase [Cu-Zn] [Pseudomonas fluorescens]
MKALLFTAALATAGAAQAQTVEMALVGADGSAKPVGTITIEQNQYGTLLTPDLRDLPPGVHGFHLHEKPSCAPATADGKTTPAGAAGGHWDPQQSKKHLGPYDDAGHKGDLPALYVSVDGTARYPVLAPRLKAEEFKGHALMVHGGGDNHSDHPEALGGGGARIACGVVQ